MRKYLLVLSIIGVSLVMASCQGNNNNGTAYTIPTGGTSGVLYSIGAAFAKTINEDEVPINLTNQVSGGAIENIRLMEKREADFSLFGGDVAFEAYEGIGMFEGNPQNESLSGVFNIYTQPLSIVTLASSDVETFSDLEGKKIAVGTPGSGNEVRTKQLLGSLDITYEDDINAQFLSISEGVEGLRDGQIDAVFVWTGLPTPGIMDLSSIRDIKLIPFTEEEVDTINSAYPSLLEFEIPGGIYRGVEEDIRTVTVDVNLFVHPEVPEEDVYEFTKAVFDNLEQLQSTVSTLRQLTEETAPDTIIELHPGAERYYREEGLIE